MTKFEIMFCIFAALHIFMELAIVGSLSKILEAISKSEDKKT